MLEPTIASIQEDELVEVTPRAIRLRKRFLDPHERIGHAADVHIRFDPLKFVDAESDGEAYYVDLDLLRAGSAVAIVCAFYNLWAEEQRLRGHPFADRHEAALDSGRLKAFPDIESLLRETIRREYMAMDDPWFDEAVAPIYRTHVLGFFRGLARLDRYA